MHSTLDRHHSTCQTVYPQFLHSVADTGWGRLAQRITFCRERELDSENEVSPTVAQPPGTLLLPTSTTLLTPVHSENDSRVYFMIVLTTELLLALLDVLYSGALQISRWLIESIVFSGKSGPKDQVALHYYYTSGSHLCTTHEVSKL